MSGQRSLNEEDCPARSSKQRRRRRRLSGLGAAVGGAFAVGMAPLSGAPAAHADIDALFEPIVDAIAQTAALVDPALPGDFAATFDVDGLLAPALSAADTADFASAASFADPMASFDALLTDWLQTYIVNPIDQLEQSWITSPLGQPVDSGAWSWLFGGSGTGLDGSPDAAADAGTAASVVAPPQPDVSPAPAAALVPQPAADPGPAAQSSTASVPLEMKGLGAAKTEPVVSISVGGGPDTDVLVDTGSAGLNIPWYDLGWQTLLQFPTGMDFGAYSGGLGYFYITLPTTVDFGNGIVTGTTSVNAVLFSWPTTLDALFGGYGNWASYFAPAEVQGVLGIGPNAGGPSPDGIVTQALPGDLSKGVLIDIPGKQLVFGPNPLSGGDVVNGAPRATLWVSIDDGPLSKVSAIMDSGGVYGTMPSSALGTGQLSGTVPGGTQITVYADRDGNTELYSYLTNDFNGPTVVSGNSMNTGYIPFTQQPIYISNAGIGQTIFGGSSGAVAP